MSRVRALGRGAFVGAACTACCAPPIIAAVGVTVGLAVAVAAFVGITLAVAVLVAGVTWTVRQRYADKSMDTTAAVVLRSHQRVGSGAPSSTEGGSRP